MPEHDREIRRREEIRSETTDIRLFPIVVVVVVLGIVLFAAGTVSKFFLRRSERADGPSAHAPRQRALPAAPRLEPLEEDQPNNAFHAIEKERLARLQSFGPTDEPDYMHVPIELAMRRVADELKASNSKAATAAHQKSQGLKYAGDANSGRVFRKEQR